MISFREASMADARRLFKWRNDPAVRESAFDTARLVWAQHKKWLQQKLVSASTKIFILTDARNRPLGQVRFDILDRKVAMIDVSIDRQQRKKGYAAQGLKKTSKFMIRKNGIKKILAYIKKDNEASIRSFQNAGFYNRGEARIKENSCYLFELKKKFR